MRGLVRERTGQACVLDVFDALYYRNKFKRFGTSTVQCCMSQSFLAQGSPSFMLRFEPMCWDFVEFIRGMNPAVAVVCLFVSHCGPRLK
jgi:hypothetical protein